MKGDLYYTFDGDCVGKMLERYMILSDAKSLKELSDAINEAMSLIEKYAEKLGCQVIFSGGDSILLKGQLDDSNRQEIKDLFYNTTGITLSCGQGGSIVEAMLNLKLAKSQSSAIRDEDKQG